MNEILERLVRKADCEQRAQGGAEEASTEDPYNASNQASEQHAGGEDTAAGCDTGLDIDILSIRC